MIKDQELRESYLHLIELGLRLQCKSVTICSAIVYFYRLSIKYPLKVKTYDRYQIARACMSAAGAREDDTIHTNAQDVLNISYNILYPNAPPLNIDDERKAKRMEEFDEIRKLLSTPAWHFTGAPKTHALLATYLNALRDWQPRLFQEYEMEQLCTMVLQDMYVCPSFIWEFSGEMTAALAVHYILKLIAPEIKTADFLKNICPHVSQSSLKKHRKFVKEKVYML